MVKYVERIDRGGCNDGGRTGARGQPRAVVLAKVRRPLRESGLRVETPDLYSQPNASDPGAVQDGDRRLRR
jgi:hypothetical protein